jgi:hypothetical protein
MWVLREDSSHHRNLSTLVGSPENCVSFKLSKKCERESYDRSGACTEAQKLDLYALLKGRPPMQTLRILEPTD